MWQLHHYYGMHLISVFPCHQPPGIRFLIERCIARNFNLCNDLSQCVLCTENENGWLGVGAGRNRKKQLFCANTMLCLSPRQRSSAYQTQRRRKWSGASPLPSVPMLVAISSLCPVSLSPQIVRECACTRLCVCVCVCVWMEWVWSVHYVGIFTHTRTHQFECTQTHISAHTHTHTHTHTNKYKYTDEQQCDPF